MASVFYKTIEGERVAITLHSLAEYEADGGIYDDSGNGGEDMGDCKDEFVCAATVGPNETGLPDNDVLELAGVQRGEYWYDSVAQYFLLRDWPHDAPVDVRCNVAP